MISLSPGQVSRSGCRALPRGVRLLAAFALSLLMWALVIAVARLV